MGLRSRGSPVHVHRRHVGRPLLAVVCSALLCSFVLFCIAMRSGLFGYAARMNAQQEISPLDVSQIQAISLDLDDTLWPVWPTIRKAEAALLAWMRDIVPVTAVHWEAQSQVIREQVKADYLEFAHDFTFLRTQMIARALAQAGDDPALAEQGFEVFIQMRQQVDLFPEVGDALETLASRYPLIAVSNGNANVLQMPIGRFFSANLPAKDAGVAKPDARIFSLAAQRLSLPNHAVLHVGDDPALDVVGAQQAGMQAVWLNRESHVWKQVHPEPLQVDNLQGLCGILGL